MVLVVVSHDGSRKGGVGSWCAGGGGGGSLRRLMVVMAVWEGSSYGNIGGVIFAVVGGLGEGWLR